MKSYGQFCPIAQSLEILAERWTLLIVRELLAGSTRFNELKRGVPRISKSLLSQRLSKLVDSKIVVRTETETGPQYRLTPAGEALRPLVVGIGVWGREHAHRTPKPNELDVGLLMWDLRRRMNEKELPDKRVVVEFHFPDARADERKYWLVIEERCAELCVTHPGLEVDLKVRTKVRVFVEIWTGDRDLRESMKDGAVQLEGSKAYQRQFPRWLLLSPFSEVKAVSAS